VAELVDVPDLGSGAFGCMGSSPFIRTDVKNKIKNHGYSKRKYR
jgi:hypothetical protein